MAPVVDAGGSAPGSECPALWEPANPDPLHIQSEGSEAHSEHSESRSEGARLSAGWDEDETDEGLDRDGKHAQCAQQGQQEQQGATWNARLRTAARLVTCAK